MAAKAERKHFSVRSLLKYLDLERNTADCDAKESKNTDHVVELQLVAATLNTLPDETTYGRQQLRQLVDFFNHDPNLQCMDRKENSEKGEAVKRFINEGFQKPNESQRQWIGPIKQSWETIKHQLENFDRFKTALDGILSAV